MVLGSQDRDKRGKVLLFISDDFDVWRLMKEIAGNDVNGLCDAG